MNVQETIKPTPLTQDHIRRNARMAPFAGWNMPIQYEGIVAESLHTRSAVSCFDICHMGEFLIQADAAKSGLERIVASSLSDMPKGSCRYSSILDDQGGVLDDLLIYRKDQNVWFIVVNAATIEKDKAHFRRHLTEDAAFTDLSEKLGKIDLQGPLSRKIIERLAPEACALKYYTFTETRILGEEAIVSRTGYTGELGYELYVPAEAVLALWEELLKDPRVKPAGLGARDVLRLEMGYSLYGQDIDEGTTPLEAGLEKFINLKKDFIGQKALLAQEKSGIHRHRVFFRSLSRRSPRHGHKIFVNGKHKGVVTSGTFSPHLQCGIGMGFMEINATFYEGLNISLGDDKIQFDAVLTNRPFVKKTSLKAGETHGDTPD